MYMESLFNSLIGVTLTDLVWLLAILFLVLYVIFAFIIVRQVNLLNRTLGTALSPLLKVFAFAHLVISIVIFLLSIILI